MQARTRISSYQTPDFRSSCCIIVTHAGVSGTWSYARNAETSKFGSRTTPAGAAHAAVPAAKQRSIHDSDIRQDFVTATGEQAPGYGSRFGGKPDGGTSRSSI